MKDSSEMASAVQNEDVLREQAAFLIVQGDSANNQQERQSFLATSRAWRAQSQQHEKVFKELQQLWQVAEQADYPSPKRKHRLVRKAGGTLLALCLITCVNWQTLQSWKADSHTSHGEIRKIHLADGSQVTLNGDSAINIRFDARQRKIELISGEVLADVAHDVQQRPFIIENRDGIARARGTRYLVKQASDMTTATVIESTVAVAARHMPGVKVDVTAGSTVRYSANHLFNLAAAPAHADSWASGRLVFQDAPLQEVIDTLKKYRSGILYVKEDAGRLQFTGVLPADNPDQALAMLQQSLPVSVNHMSPYLVWISSR